MTTSNRRARLVLWEHVAAIGAYAHADAAARAAPAGSVTASDAEAARERAHVRVLAAVNALHDLTDDFRRVLEQPFRGIVFDLFGTLVERTVERHPFRQMIAWARQQGFDTHQAGRRLMSEPLDLESALEAFEWNPPANLRAQWARELAEELDSITPYPEVPALLNDLRARGLALGLCSNLARPYAVALQRLPDVFQSVAWSFERGALKPDPVIYAAAVQGLDLPEYACLFIGDHLVEDVEGPRAIGICSRQIIRADGADLRALLHSVLHPDEED